MRIDVEIRTTRDIDRIQSGCCMKVTTFKLIMTERTAMNIGIARGRSFLLM